MGDMMNVSDVANASSELRSLIVSQAERRLEDQHAFAEAADARAATLTGVAAALSTASAGVFAACLSVGETQSPLAAAGLIAGAGFAWAAYRALQSARCTEFHPAGYRPRDFGPDVQQSKPMAQIEAEMAEDLDERLEFNSKRLIDRGRLIERAMELLWQTPVAAVTGAVVWWAVSALR